MICMSLVSRKSSGSETLRSSRLFCGAAESRAGEVARPACQAAQARQSTHVNGENAAHCSELGQTDADELPIVLGTPHDTSERPGSRPDQEQPRKDIP